MASLLSTCTKRMLGCERIDNGWTIGRAFAACATQNTPVLAYVLFVWNTSVVESLHLRLPLHPLDSPHLHSHLTLWPPLHQPMYLLLNLLEPRQETECGQKLISDPVQSNTAERVGFIGHACRCPCWHLSGLFGTLA